MDDVLKLASNRLKGLMVKRPSLAIGVWGEAGIGKTHRTLELLRATPCLSFTVHATQSLEPTIRKLPYPKKMSVWFEQSINRFERAEPFTPDQLLELTVALLAANAPVILHVEDIHEATTERLEFWQRLASSLTRTRGVGLLVTSRTQPPEGFEAIRLLSLAREASDRLLETEAGATLPPDALAWIFDRAAGNPLFTLEYFRFLSRRGFLWNDGKRWRWRNPESEVMPSTVEALLERTLREPMDTPELEDVLAAKTMLPAGSSVELWTTVSGLDFEVWNAARNDLERRGILVGHEFAHPLFREVLEHNLQQLDRQTLARRALQALEHDPQTAAKFLAAAGLKEGESLAWLERAATAASAAGDEIQCARFQADAAQYASGTTRTRLALEAAKGLRRTDTHEAVRLAELAVGLQPDDLEALYLLADLYAQEHRRDDVEDLIARLPEVERSTPAWLCRMIHLQAVAGNFDAALETWHTHPEVHSDVTTTAHVAQTLYNVGEKAEAEVLANQALKGSGLRLEQRIDLVNAQAIVQFSGGNNLGAEALFGETVRLSRQTGHPRMIGTGLSNQSTARMNMGQYREVVADIQEALHLFAASGHRRLFAQTQTLLGILQAEFGNYEQAEELLLESLRVLEQTDTQGFLPTCVRALCDLYREWAPAHGQVLALRHAHAGVRFSRPQRSPRFLVNTLPNAAATEAWNGNPERALELIEEAKPLVAQLGEPEFEMYLQVALGHTQITLGQTDQALEAFGRAQGVATSLSAWLDAHKCGLEIARLEGSLDLARTHMQWFEQRGLVNGVNIARRYFPELADQPELAPPTLKVRLEVLGPMRFKAGAEPLPVRGRKRQEFLAVLLEAHLSGRSEISRLDLLDALYPNAIEAQASTALKSLVRELREQFGINTIRTTTSGYALGEVASDAEDFLKTGETRLWRGAYLDGLSLEQPNETVRETLHLALRSRAENLLETDPNEAARIGNLLYDAEPYDLEHLHLHLRALRAGKNHKTLARTYAQARERSLEVGQVLPATWAAFLEAGTAKNA